MEYTGRAESRLPRALGRPVPEEAPPAQKPSVPDPFAAEREKHKSMGTAVPVRPGVDPSKEAEAKSIARSAA